MFQNIHFTLCNVNDNNYKKIAVLNTETTRIE